MSRKKKNDPQENGSSQTASKKCSCKFCGAIAGGWRFLSEHSILLLLILSFLVNFTVEILARRSFWAVCVYLGTKPWMFGLNMLLVMALMCIALFVPKKTFVYLAVSVVWLALGTINFIVLGNRTTPLSAIDFEVIWSAFDVIPAYMSLFEIILAAAVTVGLIVLLVVCFRCSKSLKSHFLSASIFTAIVVLGVGALLGISLNVERFRPDFRNLPRAYRNYGFVYCFTSSILENGIDEPIAYSEQKMEQLRQLLASGDNGENDQKPNVVIVQLESFFDPALFKGISMNADPIPNFTALKEQCSTGKVTVPALGGGTANTEFEMLTGMSLDFFSAGEYPYTSILQESTCESIAYNLKERGYGAFAIHNHKGTFYDRNIVYANLGFDYFISAENMEPLEYTPRNWEKDGILTDQILQCLDMTDHSDLVFTVTVQGHGKYPTNRRTYERHVRVNPAFSETGAEKSYRHQLEYYINQLYETDRFIGELVKALEERGEPVVLLLYGDHLPALDLTEADVTDGNLYQTDYVIWDNIGLPKQQKDLKCYEMSAYLMKQIGYSNGLITKYHQLCNEDTYYYDNLGKLEYDLLYGERYLYQKQSLPFQKTDLHFGLHDVKINNVSTMGNTVVVSGENFTTHSKIYINDDKQTTVYVGPDLIKVDGVELKYGDTVFVGQAATELDDLGRSEKYVY